MLCLILAISLSFAQQMPDSVSLRPTHGPGFPVAPVATGASAVGLSVLSRQLYPHSGFRNPDPHERTSRGTTVLQFVPTALPWAMKAFGHPTRSTWKQLALSNAASLALTAAIVYPVKNSVTSPRPDGTDSRSFPSGHSAWAFAGATIMERELGWCSEWYTIGAYTFATGIAVERVIDGHHYPTDVFAGAGIGILATRLGYFISDLIVDSRSLRTSTFSLESSNNNLSYFSLETGLCLPLGPVDFGDGVKIIRLPAISAGVRGGFAIEDNWGVAVEAGLQSTPLLLDVRHDRTNIATQTGVGLIISPYFRMALNRRISISADAGAGYYKNFRINSIGHAVKGSGGTPVGRINAGAIMRFSDHLSLKASAGLQLSHYSYQIEPSTAYHCDVTARRSGVTPSLLINISTRYEF